MSEQETKVVEEVKEVVQTSTSTDWMNLEYNIGFGNHFESEAEVGALPKG